MRPTAHTKLIDPTKKNTGELGLFKKYLYICALKAAFLLIEEIEISENSSVAKRINNKYALPTEIQCEKIEISENSSVGRA